MKLNVSRSSHEEDRSMKDLPRLADVLAARHNDVETFWNLASFPASFLCD